MLKIYITRQFGNEKSQNVFSYKTRNQAKMQNLKAKNPHLGTDPRTPTSFELLTFDCLEICASDLKGG